MIHFLFLFNLVSNKLIIKASQRLEKRVLLRILVVNRINTLSCLKKRGQKLKQCIIIQKKNLFLDTRVLDMQTLKNLIRCLLASRILRFLSAAQTIRPKLSSQVRDVLFRLNLIIFLKFRVTFRAAIQQAKVELFRLAVS